MLGLLGWIRRENMNRIVLMVVGCAATLLLSSAAWSKKVDAESYDIASIVKMCKKKNSAVSRDECITELTGGNDLPPVDILYLRERLTIDTSGKPFVVDIPSEKLQAAKPVSTVAPFVVIGKIRDLRVFEQFSGGTPYYGQESKLPEDRHLNQHLIGRSITTIKGSGVGARYKVRDITLGEDLTVTDIVQKAAIAGLEAVGFRVVTVQSDATKDAPIIDIDIHRYWLWNGTDATSLRDFSDRGFSGYLELAIQIDNGSSRDLTSIAGRSKVNGRRPSRLRSWTNSNYALLKVLIARIGKFGVANIGSTETIDLSDDPNYIFKQARKCQNKGDVWINDICQIPLD